MTKDNSHHKQVAAGIRYLRKTDKKLAAIIRRVGPLYYKSKRVGFEALVHIITGQQLSGKAAESIFQRLRAATPNRRITQEGLAGLDDSALRLAGMSNAKVRAIRDLIAKCKSGQLNIRRFQFMSDEEVAQAITSVKGLGPWSAHMYLMFVLVRLDVFSGGDLGIQKAIGRLYGVDRKRTDFQAFGDRWKPYRTLACWYLWASLDNASDKKK